MVNFRRDQHTTTNYPCAVDMEQVEVECYTLNVRTPANTKPARTLEEVRHSKEQ